MIQTPTKATNIDIKVDFLRTSPKIKYPTIAAMNGIAANINKVTAAVVIVIENIKPYGSINSDFNSAFADAFFNNLAKFILSKVK